MLMQRMFWELGILSPYQGEIKRECFSYLLFPTKGLVMMNLSGYPLRFSQSKAFLVSLATRDLSLWVMRYLNNQ